MVIIFFSKSLKTLGLIRTLTYSFSALDSLLSLYFTLVRSVLEYASPVLNNITTADTSKLERIQQKLACLCFKRFSLNLILIMLKHLRL